MSNRNNYYQGSPFFIHREIKKEWTFCLPQNFAHIACIYICVYMHILYVCIYECVCVCVCVYRRGQWHPTPVLLSGKSRGRRSMVGCSPWVVMSRTWLSDFTFTFNFHALEKEMATQSSVLAWRIPGMREPCGLPSMGSHRVGHDWSDLAAAAKVYSNTSMKSKTTALHYPVIRKAILKDNYSCFSYCHV